MVATADESTLWYVRSIASAAAKAGIQCRLVDLGAEATEPEIAKHLTELSNDSDVHGIILQTPLPAGVAAARLVGHIAPHKDIDGANPVSLGRLAVGEPAFAPATARAVIELLDYHQIPISGRHVAVVGRSAVVGKPLLHLLLQRDATVTICHSRSTPLDTVHQAGGHRRRRGRPTRPAHRRPPVHRGGGDRRRNQCARRRQPGRRRRPASVSTVAAALSPVPGGVGSVTTALLLLHTVDAARAALGG